MLNSKKIKIINDLFLEQEVPVLALCYKHGIFRAIAVLISSLLFSQRDLDADCPFISGSTVAIVFFPNEVQAAHRASIGSIKIDRIIHLHPHCLSIIRRTLGWKRMFRSAIFFIRTVVALKGLAYIGRLTYPLLGWLLYETYIFRLKQVSDVSVVTTNMVHPLSISVAWAASDSGHSSIYYEHATTPRIMFKNRGYSDYFVDFSHTGKMIQSFGIDALRVHVRRQFSKAIKPRHRNQIHRVGICVNPLDSVQTINEVARVINGNGLEFSIRIHDADPRVKQIRSLAERFNADWSSARETRIEKFLETVDLIVVGNSNVVSDAIFADCRVIYYWTGDEDLFDYYGLITHCHVPHARDPVELESVIQKLLINKI